MSTITDIKIGQSLPPERWNEAADHLEMAAPIIARVLLRLNGDGMGEQDAADFMADATLAAVACRHVALFCSEQCRFIPVPSNKAEGGNPKNEQS